MQKLLSDSVYTTGLHPATSTPLLIPWRTLQPELLVVLQVAFTTRAEPKSVIWKVVKKVKLVTCVGMNTLTVRLWCFICQTRKVVDKIIN